MHLQPVLSLLPLSLYTLPALAAVTVYGTGTQAPLGISSTATATGAAANYTGSAAYNPTVLNAPAVPDPKPPNAFDIKLANGGMAGMSIPIPSSFFGFSVEFSVANQVLGKNSSLIQVPFLNLMANLQERAGTVHIRVGGNTQETASLVDEIADYRDIQKDYSQTTNPTATPPLVYNRDILYMMANISDFVNVKWYLGIPFNDTSNFRLQIAEVGQAILGEDLIGLQVGNEPDLYSHHGHRPDTYGPSDYVGEFGQLVDALGKDSNVQNRSMLIGPNLAGQWTPQEVWDTGFVKTYQTSISALAVEHYPTDNCQAAFGIGTAVDPQTVFPTFLTHTAGQKIVQPYLESTAYAQTMQKPFVMFETNTASCGGFPGISDSFGAALWGADYGLQMAYSNFSGALFHVGGQNVFYNPFTPPPTNQSAFHQWTVGPIYYSALVVAEALGASNTSQVMDLGANGGNEFTPAYAIYENGTPARIALFNYVTDASGASDYTASVSVGDATPGSVKVKYLSADSVSQKANFTWAGQTFGGVFGSDGRLSGDKDIQTVTCSDGTCKIKVPAPSFVLVFLNDQALTESDSGASMTFPTSLHTKTMNTATIDPSVLATSNGHSGFGRGSGRDSYSTSKGSLRENAASKVLPSLMALFGVVAGGAVVRRALTK